MAKDDEKQDSGYTLEEILAEYGVDVSRWEEEDRAAKDPPSDPGPDLPWPEAKRTPPPQNVVLFPGMTAPPDEDEDEEEGPEDGDEDTGGGDEAPEEPAPPPREKPKKAPVTDKVLEFPEDDTPPLQAGLRHLKEKADAFSQQMFAEEGTEVSEETIRFQKLIPGVDEEEREEEDEPPRRERKPRKPPEPPPDLPPADLAGRYGRGLGLLRLRAVLVALLCLPLLYLAFAGFFGLPLPGALTDSFQLRVWCSGGLLAVVMVLGLDVLLGGLIDLLRPGGATAALFACASTLWDAFTQLTAMPERTTLPYCAACCAGLFCAMWGTYAKRQGLRLSCRTAAAASEPYLVTLDHKSWNGKDAYAKWSGPSYGFGSQIQEPDGTERALRISVPLLLLGSILCALVASVGHGAPERLPWCLSACATASSGFSALLCFSRPYRALARRLASSGAALPGWSGVERVGKAILLTDTDLFPPGEVALNGIKIFGDYSVEKVVAVCATLIKESGSGLDKVFHDLLRTQGAVYRRCSGFTRHEGGGLSADIRGEHILVGSASFMTLMEVPLPQGLNVRSAVFCAIDGELAGIFALNYMMHPTIPPAISALTANRVSPVLCTRDFNLIPAMLRQKFKLPVEKMDFPAVERRTELSDPAALHSARLTAVLCREGLAPFSEAVVGAKRLRLAVLMTTALTVLGSVIGLLLAFYLTFVGAWSSLTGAQMAIFLLAWTVPTLLISGWVERY